MTKISKNFHDYEFVSKTVYDRYGSNSKWFIDPDIVFIAEFYRGWFKAPVRVNDWHWGGRFHERGYRTPDSKTGARLSQHKMKAAFDCDIKGISANDVRKEILENQDIFMAAGVTTLEHEAYAKTWVHTDKRVTDLEHILIVKPIVKTVLGGIDLLTDTDEFFRYENGKFLNITYI